MTGHRKKQPLRDRVRANVKEVGECWIWQGPYNHNHPIISYRAPGQDRNKSTGVRLALLLDRGARIIPGHIAMNSCDNTRCVREDHIVQRSGREYRATRLRKVTNHQKRKALIAKARRAKSRFSDEVIAAIRESTEPQRVLAERYNMSPSYVSAIRKGRSRQVYTNPFAGLLV